MLVELIDWVVQKVAGELPAVDEGLIHCERKLVELDETLARARARAGLGKKEEDHRDA